ncbi:MAG: MBL fold metallo-hydrolase [Ruminococcaceae bacterium]|nr:MBL fold metallo-hydrolase [Oscillospiraceae bacterium]
MNKKILHYFSVIMTILLISIMSFSSFAALLGDVDNSGKVDSSDARTVLRASVGLEELTPSQKRLSDADGDSAISSSDARLILRTSVGLEEYKYVENDSYFEVHFIDVGQADCALILCDDESLLIDGGNVADSERIVSYLINEEITELDYVICTHAHEDHVGGLYGPLEYFTVTESIFAPETSSDTQCYARFLSAVEKQDKILTKPECGDTFSLGSAQVTFIGPVTENYTDINNTSIVTKITYNETSFLFTGDAERESEQDILSSGADITADVLKVGHHGSENSTTYPFLREIMPEIAVISVGEGNNYGHPTEDALSRLRDADTKVYRTDLQGNIIIKSDGKNLTVDTEKNKDIETNPTERPATPLSYIGNKNSQILHLPTCSSLPKEENRIYFSDRTAALDSGYKPCSRCKP